MERLERLLSHFSSCVLRIYSSSLPGESHQAGKYIGKGADASILGRAGGSVAVIATAQPSPPKVLQWDQALTLQQDQPHCRSWLPGMENAAGVAREGEAKSEQGVNAAGRIWFSWFRLEADQLPHSALGGTSPLCCAPASPSMAKLRRWLDLGGVRAITVTPGLLGTGHPPGSRGWFAASSWIS